MLGYDTRQIDATYETVMDDEPLRSVLARPLNRKDLDLVDEFLKDNGCQRLHRHIATMQSVGRPYCGFTPLIRIGLCLLTAPAHILTLPTGLGHENLIVLENSCNGLDGTSFAQPLLHRDR